MLLQTLVMSVVLSMMAVMVMKWVLARYLLAARNYRAAEAKGRSQGVTGRNFATWNPWHPGFPTFAAIPTNGTVTTPEGLNVTYSRTAINAQGSMRFTVTVDQDPPP